MARIKYYYDTETCKYERIKVSKWDIFLNSLGFFSVALILAVVIYIFQVFRIPTGIAFQKGKQGITQLL